jgi:hypothetical protein
MRVKVVCVCVCVGCVRVRAIHVCVRVRVCMHQHVLLEQLHMQVLSSEHVHVALSTVVCVCSVCLFRAWVWACVPRICVLCTEALTYVCASTPYAIATHVHGRAKDVGEMSSVCVDQTWVSMSPSFSFSLLLSLFLSNSVCVCMYVCAVTACVRVCVCVRANTHAHA